MTESHPRGGEASPRSAGPGPEIPPVGQIFGHDVRVSYGHKYVAIHWRTKDWVTLNFQDAGISAGITRGQTEDLVSLRLDIAFGYSRLLVDLPFYDKDIDQLQAFVGVLHAKFPGHADRIPGHADHARTDTGGAAQGGAGPHGAVQPAPPGEAAAAARGQVGDGERAGKADKRERQVTPVVSICTPFVPWADDEDWISLRPPAETERLLRLSRNEPAKPEPENSQHA